MQEAAQHGWSLCFDHVLSCGEIVEFVGVLRSRALLFSLVVIVVVLAGLDVVVMGSNIGIETSFFALTYPEVQVYGYDLLCAFVGRAKELQVGECFFFFALASR